MLFRVLRGSGLTGLAGIHPVTADGFIRPLIGVTRGEVLEFLRERGIEWREDASNVDLRFARNRIRHSLLPQLAREWNPKIVDALANLGDLAYEEERAWTIRERDSLLDRLSYQNLPRAEARRAVRRAIREVKGDLRGIEFGHVEGVIEMGGDESGCAGGRCRAVLRRIGIVKPVRPDVPDPVEVTVPGTYAAPDGATEIRLGTLC